MTSPRLAIATTLRDSADVVHTFLRYHRSLGFDHFFLFFDDPDDPAYDSVSRFPDVTCWRTGPELLAEHCAVSNYDHHAQYVATEVMARQNLNIVVALTRVRDLGIDWLLHIDMDELLHVPGHDARALFADSNADEIVFLNHEAVPETDPIGDFFREVSLWKLNPSSFTARGNWLDSFWHRRGWYFNGYPQGKAAARIAAQPLEASPHRFRSDYKKLKTVYHDEASVLHFQTCGLSRFTQKYRTLGRFADQWFGHAPITLRFHTGARDVVLDGTADEITAYYRKHVLLEGASIEREIERGCLVRIELPARLFEDR